MIVPKSVETRTKKKLSEMHPGDCFLYCGAIFMKLATYVNSTAEAVRVQDGQLVLGLTEEYVTLPTAEVVV